LLRQLSCHEQRLAGRSQVPHLEAQPLQGREQLGREVGWVGLGLRGVGFWVHRVLRKTPVFFRKFGRCFSYLHRIMMRNRRKSSHNPKYFTQLSWHKLKKCQKNYIGINNLENKIKRKLNEQSMTIQRLATESGVSEPTLRAIFNSGDAKLSQLEKLQGAEYNTQFSFEWRLSPQQFKLTTLIKPATATPKK